MIRPDRTVVNSLGEALPETRSLALRLLARREHSRFELKNKLLKRGVDKNIVSTLLADLCGHDLVSDKRFTEIYVRARKNRGYGPLKIHAELRERGVAETLIRDALEASDEFWFKQAQKVLVKRFGEASGMAKEELKNPAELSQRDLARKARFLSARGFPATIIYRSLDAQTV